MRWDRWVGFTAATSTPTEGASMVVWMAAIERPTPVCTFSNLSAGVHAKRCFFASSVPNQLGNAPHGCFPPAGRGSAPWSVAQAATRDALRVRSSGQRAPAKQAGHPHELRLQLKPTSCDRKRP